MVKPEKLPEGVGNASIRLTVTPSDVAKEAFLHVQKIGYLQANQIYSVSSDHLDCFLLLIVLHGEGTLEYENNEYQLKKGNIFFIDCEKNHKYYASKKGWHVLYIYFNGSSARAYYNIISQSKTPVFQTGNYNISMSLFWEVLNLHQKNNSLAEELTSLHLTRILTEIILLLGNLNYPKIVYPKYITDVFNHITRYYDEKITLDMLAELYSINKFHLIKEFKRFTGTTIIDHIIKTRINRAKSLLHDSNKSIDQIAKEVGFNSTAHFIRTFRNKEYITPNFYRKQWTE